MRKKIQQDIFYQQKSNKIEHSKTGYFPQNNKLWNELTLVNKLYLKIIVGISFIRPKFMAKKFILSEKTNRIDTKY